jgi:tetratricopeptide (TPR) repeat protein
MVSALLLGGCAVGQAIKNNVQGTHYLQAKKYKEGEAIFRDAVVLDPDSPQANYYLGRFLLADKKPKQALQYLQKAASLEPKDVDYLFWQGVSLGELGKWKQERASYKSVLKRNKKHLQALIYLGHNQLRVKEYKAALATYQEVLGIWPYSPSALYNRALIARILNRTPEEKIGWLTYLSAYPSGALATKAVDHLNRIGDFSYRNHYLGVRTIPLTKIWFKPFDSKLDQGSLPSLDVIGATASNMGRGKLQVVVYQKENKKLARARAVSIREYLQDKFPGLKKRGIGISWFDQAERLEVEREKLNNPESVRFFMTGL